MSWFTVLRLLLYRSVLELFSKSFKVFHCSVINVRCCYFQQLVYFIISSSRCQQLFYFFFVVVLSRQLWYLIMSVAFCQQLFESFYLIQSGEGGIWTLAPLFRRPTPLAGAPLRPLEYYSRAKCVTLIQKMAERVGFEPTVRCRTAVFKTASLNHSDISPRGHSHTPYRMPI